MRSFRAFRAQLAMAGLLLTLAGGACGAAGAARPNAARPNATRPNATRPNANVAYAHVHAATDIDGNPAARYFTPGEPTIFVVFASWCVHCRHELALLDELRRSDPHVHIIGLNAYEDWEQASDETKLRAYLAANAPWLPVVRTDAPLLTALGGVPKIPSVFVFDASGRLIHRFKRDEREPPSLSELRSALGTVLPN